MTKKILKKVVVSPGLFFFLFFNYAAATPITSEDLYTAADTPAANLEFARNVYEPLVDAIEAYIKHNERDSFQTDGEEEAIRPADAHDEDAKINEEARAAAAAEAAVAAEAAAAAVIYLTQPGLYQMILDADMALDSAEKALYGDIGEREALSVELSQVIDLRYRYEQLKPAVFINDQTAPVPEPSTMMLFGIGMLGLAAVSRRKQK